MTDEPKKKRTEPTSWVVQMRKNVAGAKTWDDIDVLDVPAGTKRKTLMEKVRTLDLGLEVGESACVRLIPYEHVREEHVEMVQSPPTLKVGP